MVWRSIVVDGLGVCRGLFGRGLLLTTRVSEVEGLLMFSGSNVDVSRSQQVGCQLFLSWPGWS